MGQIEMSDKVPVDDVVVLLPGIMGSVLQRDGDVWAISPQAVLKALVSGGGDLKDLALKVPGDRPSPDGITATRLFSDTHLIPHFWTIDGYGKVGEVLRTSLDATPGENYFEFPYDWRLDNRVAAAQLKEQSSMWLAKWRDQGHPDARLVLLAHSMGGLVARFFIECLEGWPDVRLLITMGTPYHGSVRSLGFLVNGYPVKIGPVKIFDFSDVIRTFPSVYQLLPTYKCLDLGNGKLIELRDAPPLPNVDPDLLKDAIDFHDQIASAVKTHRQLNKYRDAGYEIHPVVGTEQTTELCASFERGALAARTTYPGKTWAGDTTVPWISAHPLDDPARVEAGAYYVECHGSLQNGDDVLVEIRNLIARFAARPEIVKVPPSAGIALDVADIYSAQPVIVTAKTSVDLPLFAEVVEVTSGQSAVPRTTFQRGDDHVYRAEIPDLPQGMYRVTVAGDGPVRPVTDVFVVLK
jgi:hypothetical protein